MKVYTCENIDNQVIKIFSSKKLAEDFRKDQNEKYDERELNYKVLDSHNPGKKEGVLEKIRSGKANEIPELVSYVEEVREFNNKYKFVERVEDIIEYDME